MTDEFPLEELAGLPEFAHPRVSPDGERVAVYWDATGRNELHVLELATGEMRQVSDGEVPRSARWPILWGPDGDRVYFHRDDAGDEQNDVYAIDLGCDVSEVLSVDGQCVVRDVSAAGLLFISDVGEQLNLYRARLDGTDVRQLTEYDWPVETAAFGPDGERIAYVTNESDDAENRDTYVADIDGNDARRLPAGEEGSETYPVSFGPEGDRLLVSDNATDLGRCGVYDLDADEVTWYGAGEYEEQPVAFRPDGSEFLATRVRDAGVAVVAYDLSGDSRELDLPEGVATVADAGFESVFTSDEEFVLAHGSSDEREQLYSYDLAADERSVLLESEYGAIDPEAFVEADYVTYESADGLEVGALLYDSGERPSPAVVRVHTGPHQQAQREFDPYTQFLVNRGYTVLLPNYRGSTGRGREFKNRVHGDWGGGEQDDITAGADWLADEEWIDEDRIGVLGGSFGGYSVYMQLATRPDRWAAGVARVGITDLPSLYEESLAHFKSNLEEQMGDPEENAELWRDRSPLTHVENVEAPLLMLHGVNDRWCPISQARQFRDALEDRGWTEGEDGDFEYVELGDEGHGSAGIDQKIRSFRMLEDYLDRRL